MWKFLGLNDLLTVLSRLLLYFHLDDLFSTDISGHGLPFLSVNVILPTVTGAEALLCCIPAIYFSF